MKSQDLELEVVSIHISETNAGEHVRQYSRCSHQPSSKGSKKGFRKIYSFIHSFIHSTNKEVLRVSCVSGTVLGTGAHEMNKPDTVLTARTYTVAGKTCQEGLTIQFMI